MKSWQNTLDRNNAFWRAQPALLYAIFTLIGVGFSLFSIHWVWPLLAGAYAIFCKQKIALCLLVYAIGYGAWSRIPEVAGGEIEAVFSPSSLQTHATPFHKDLLYKGTLQTKFGALPCTIAYAKGVATHPSADCSYRVHGKLAPRDGHMVAFKPKTWEPVAGTFSLAEMRYQTKEAFKRCLQTHLSSKKAATFLSAMTTGDVDDRLLRYEFGRVGLQHLLTISGFHFGILIAFCSFCLNFFLSRPQRICALFILVTLYYLFVGSSPAVQRSWMTAALFLGSEALRRPSSGLNLLGIALLIEVFLDPYVVSHIGFQLSFLSCAGILLLCPLLETQLQVWLPKRNWPEIRALSRPSQHVYLLCHFFRKAISLTFAVNIAMLPLLLFHFHQFPLLGLLYNLFVPFLVAVAMSLLLLALIFLALFPPIATLFFTMTNALTTELLHLVAQPPLVLNFSMQTASLTPDGVILYLITLACALHAAAGSLQKERA